MTAGEVAVARVPAAMVGELLAETVIRAALIGLIWAARGMVSQL